MIYCISMINGRNQSPNSFSLFNQIQFLSLFILYCKLNFKHNLPCPSCMAEHHSAYCSKQSFVIALQPSAWSWEGPWVWWFPHLHLYYKHQCTSCDPTYVRTKDRSVHLLNLAYVHLKVQNAPLVSLVTQSQN